MNNLAYVYVFQDRFEKAEPLARTALEIHRRILGPEHPRTLPVEDTLGTIYLKTGRFKEAEVLFRKLVPIAERVLGEDNWDLPNYRAHLGMTLVELENYDEAEPLLLQAYPRVQAAQEQARDVILSLIKLYDGWGKPDKAAEWRAKLAEPEKQ
jgi:Flp pilus assembly protein TadD